MDRPSAGRIAGVQAPCPIVKRENRPENRGFRDLQWVAWNEKFLEFAIRRPVVESNALEISGLRKLVTKSRKTRSRTSRLGARRAAIGRQIRRRAREVLRSFTDLSRSGDGGREFVYEAHRVRERIFGLGRRTGIPGGRRFESSGAGPGSSAATVDWSPPRRPDPDGARAVPRCRCCQPVRPLRGRRDKAGGSAGSRAEARYPRLRATHGYFIDRSGSTGPRSGHRR